MSLSTVPVLFRSEVVEAVVIIIVSDRDITQCNKKKKNHKLLSKFKHQSSTHSPILIPKPFHSPNNKPSKTELTTLHQAKFPHAFNFITSTIKIELLHC